MLQLFLLVSLLAMISVISRNMMMVFLALAYTHDRCMLMKSGPSYKTLINYGTVLTFSLG